jgi:hypothetical protein
LENKLKNWVGKRCLLEAVCAKNDKKAALVVLLTELAEYVILTCNGNRLMLLSSGFHVSGDKFTRGLDPVIQQLEVELGPP